MIILVVRFRIVRSSLICFISVALKLLTLGIVQVGLTLFQSVVLLDIVEHLLILLFFDDPFFMQCVQSVECDQLLVLDILVSPLFAVLR